MQSCTLCSGRLDHCGPFQRDPCSNWDSCWAGAVGPGSAAFPPCRPWLSEEPPCRGNVSRDRALLGSEAFVPRESVAQLLQEWCARSSCWFQCPWEQSLACLPAVSTNVWGEQLGVKVRTASPARCTDWNIDFLRDWWYLSAFRGVWSHVLQVMFFTFPGNKLNVCMCIFMCIHMCMS